MPPIASFLFRRFAACCLACATMMSVIGFLDGPLVQPVFGQESSQLDSSNNKSTKKLFDGKTLAGWNGDSKWFRAKDGVIIAGSLDEKIPHNQFLCTNEVFGDFELSLEAKLVGKGNNAGVQFRTKRIPNDTEVSGFQADIGDYKTGTCWGALYDESRRRKFLAETSAEAAKTVRRKDWNTLKVIAKGNHIQIFLNGVLSVDYSEEDASIEATGVIALQVHSGPPLEAHYRNIKFKSLE